MRLIPRIYRLSLTRSICLISAIIRSADAIIAEAIELLGDDVAMIHIKDFVAENGALKSVAAGTGEMDYTQIIRFIKERKPHVHVTLEDTVPENAVAARKYIQRLWDEM